MRTSSVLALAALAVLAGCTTRRVVDRPVAVGLERPGTLTVDLFAGDVTLCIDDTLDQVQMQVIRESTHGWFRGDEAKAAMKTIDCSLRRIPGVGPPAVELKATTDDPEAYFLRANVNIHTPPIYELTVRTHRGKVDLRGVSGPLDVTTSDGDVTLVTTHPLTDPVTITTSNGTISLRVPGASRGALDLQTVNGRARAWTPAGGLTIEAVTGPERVKGVLNEGDNPIVLRTTNGDIRLQAVEDVIAAGNYDG